MELSVFYAKLRRVGAHDLPFSHCEKSDLILCAAHHKVPSLAQEACFELGTELLMNYPQSRLCMRHSLCFHGGVNADALINTALNVSPLTHDNK